MRARLIIVLFTVFLSGCVASSTNLIAEGDQALARGDFDSAVKSFGLALENQAITQLDRTAAEIGVAIGLLGKTDYVGAETRLRRLSDQISAKWYYLAKIAVAREKRGEAIDFYKKALARQHGKDTGLRLALLIGGEARDFGGLAEAAKVLEASGHGAKAAAIGEAADVWRGILAGAAPKGLLERLSKHVAELEDYPAAQVVRGHVFDLLEKRKQATAAWDLSGIKPAPTRSFLEHSLELRARLAIERGDRAVLAEVLERADPKTAARVRNPLAESQLWRGDSDGPDGLWRDTVAKGGEPAPLASANLGRQLEQLGRLKEANKAWATAWSSKSTDPRLLALLALHLAAQGDLLGGCALLADVEPAALGPEQAEAERLLSAGRLLEAALEQHAEGNESAASGLSYSVRLRVPLEPVSLTLEGKTVKDAPTARGHSLLAFKRAQLVLALRGGHLGEAIKLVTWWNGLAADEGERIPLPRSTFLEALAANLHAGLRRGLQLGKRTQALALLKAAALPDDDPALAEVRACSCLASLSMPKPRGLLALPPGTTWGVLALPKAGRRFGRVGITRKGATWTLRLPGTVIELKNQAAFEDLLGTKLSKTRWTESLEGESFEPDVEAAWKSRRPRAPTLRVP